MNSDVTLGELLVINRPSNGPGYLQEGMRRPAKAPPTVCGLAFATRTGWINRIAGLGSRRATQNQNCVFIGD